MRERCRGLDRAPCYGHGGKIGISAFPISASAPKAVSQIRRRRTRELCVDRPTFYLLSLVSLASCAAPVCAQAGGLALSGNARIRYEILNGQARAGLADAIDLVSLRTVLAAEYRTGPVRLVVELWDSRAWGGDAGDGIGTGEVNTTEPVQAYVAADLGPVLGQGSKASVQAGRFTLNLGSRRLVAADDYRNTTNGYTGVKIDLASARGGTASLVYVLPQMRRPDDEASVLDNRAALDRESFDLQLWGGYAAQAIGRRTIAELGYFRLLERDAPGRPTRNRDLHSISLRLMLCTGLRAAGL